MYSHALTCPLPHIAFPFATQNSNVSTNVTCWHPCRKNKAHGATVKWSSSRWKNVSVNVPR